MDLLQGTNSFWILAAALKLFVSTHGCLPVSGHLPDMTSDSRRYTQLLGIYRRKAEQDAQEIHKMALSLLKNATGIPQNGHTITLEQCKEFCKFAAFIGVQKSELKAELNEDNLKVGK